MNLKLHVCNLKGKREKNKVANLASQLAKTK